MNKIAAFFAAIPEWCESHPTITALVILPLLMALVNFFLKPRSEEEYAAIAAESPRFASFLRLLRKIFPDPKGAYDALKGVIVRKGPPLAMLALLVIGAASMGCAPAKSPEDARAIQRSYITMAGRGIGMAADVCLETAKELCDVDEDGLCQNDSKTAEAHALAKACRDAYNVARGALLAADDGLNAKTALDEGETACAVAKGLDGLEKIRELLKPYVKLPEAVDDVARYVRALAGQCQAADAGGS